jgi:hypothetical protein
VVLLLFSYGAFLAPQKKTAFLYRLFLGLYAGFWLTTFLFKGVAWSYYYWPFMGLTAILFTGLNTLLNPKIFWPLFLIVISLNTINNLNFCRGSRSAIGRSGGSWKFNYQLATAIFKNAPQEFGYYVYSPDLFGYPQKFALHFVQSQFSHKQSFPFTKKATTYLIINPPPGDKPYLKGDWWKTQQVKITNKPVQVIRYPNNLVVEKYQLNKMEQQISADPNLIQDLHFR